MPFNSHLTFQRFSNSDSQVENEFKANLPQKAGVSTEQLSGVEETVLKLSSQISTLTRQQKYFRTRENRNFSTVKSTERRIFNFSLIEGGLMVAMAALQVFIVKMFFTGGRKGESSALCMKTVTNLMLIDNRVRLNDYICMAWAHGRVGIECNEHIVTLFCIFESIDRKVQAIPSIRTSTTRIAYPTLFPSSITMYSSPTIIFISSSTMKFS